ncbi:MAG: hypothetical protein ACI841_003988 [Planctomycetota bacterium]|jgi:hypothetical protein
MSYYDNYLPDPEIHCHACSERLADWQGVDGPGCWLFWKQGLAAPTGQDAGDFGMDTDELAKERLPQTFEIYTMDCSCPFTHLATGVCEEGVWVRTVLERATNAKQGPHERKGDWKRRLAWLKKTPPV